MVQAAAAAPAASGWVLRRTCACRGDRETDCEDCRKRATLHRQAISNPAATVPPLVRAVLRTPGKPLDAATRGAMEARFEHDFARVRIHADASGAASARAVEARAYAVGNHVVFADGQYAPGTHTGQKLLAHELTHVVQDTNRLAADSSSLELGASDAREEIEADAVADGRRVPASIQPCAPLLAVRRQPKEGACTEEFLAKVEPIAERTAAFLNRAASALKAVRPDEPTTSRVFWRSTSTYRAAPWNPSCPTSRHEWN